MKAVISWGLAAIAIALGLFLWLAPAYYDSSFNSPLPHEPYDVSPEAAEIYDGLPGISDLHVDILLWDRDLLKRNDYGHVDIPRSSEGNMAVQVFGVVTKSPWGQNYDDNSADSDRITVLVMAQLWPPRTWTSLKERALYQAEKLVDFADRSDGLMTVVRTKQGLEDVLERRANGEPVVAALIGLEGAHALEGKLENVDVLFDAGFRTFGLTHFFDNKVAGSVHGIDKYGLTPLGRQVVARAQELGMVIDVAHASRKTIADVFEMATGPVVFSHGGVKGTCETNRNLTDEEVRGIAKTGGVVALGAWDAATCGETPADLARAMAHVRDLVGAQYVSIGTDFDGAVKAAFTIAEFDALVQALLDEGFAPEEIEAVMYGNIVRLLRNTLPDN